MKQGGISTGYDIEQQLIRYNVGGDLSPIGLIIHDTENAGATAQNHFDYFNGGDRQASAHAFVDWNRIIQTVSWSRVAWHAGPTANHSRIGIELCVPSSYNVGEFNEIWNRGVWLSAYLLRNIIGTTVVTKINMMSHAEASNTWGETDHLDPASYFREYGKTMDDFRNAVQQALNGGNYDSSGGSNTSRSWLERGDSGSKVLELQQKLNKISMFFGLEYDLSEDGDYGSKTEAAVTDFQMRYGLEVDGLAGNQVFGKLNELVNQIDNPPKPAVMYRVILDGKQIEALSYYDNAVAEVKNAVDSGRASYGKVQRNTDGVDLFTYEEKSSVELGNLQEVKHEIMGSSECSVEQAETFLHMNNEEAPYYADIYKKYGEMEGVRWDVAFAQSMHETGYFEFGGNVLASQNNFAGLGSTDVGIRGAEFNTPDEGILAQIQHLKAYASTKPLNTQLIDPRFNLVQRGIAPCVEDLNGRWAVPGNNYGQQIMQIVDGIKAATPDEKYCKKPADSGNITGMGNSGNVESTTASMDNTDNVKETSNENDSQSFIVKMLMGIIKLLISLFAGKSK